MMWESINLCARYLFGSASRLQVSAAVLCSPVASLEGCRYKEVQGWEGHGIHYLPEVNVCLYVYNINHSFHHFSLSTFSPRQVGEHSACSILIKPTQTQTPSKILLVRVQSWVFSSLFLCIVQFFHDVLVLIPRPSVSVRHSCKMLSSKEIQQLIVCSKNDFLSSTSVTFTSFLLGYRRFTHSEAHITALRLSEHCLLCGHV